MSRTIYAAFLLTSLFTLTVGVASLLNMRKQAESDRLVLQTERVLEKLARTRTGIVDAETGQRGFIITNLERYLEPYRTGAVAAQEALAELRRLTVDNPAQQTRLDRLEPLIQERLQMLAETIQLRRDVGFDAATRNILTHRGKATMDAIRGVISDMEAEERRLLIGRDRERQMDASMTIATVALGVLLSTFIAGLAIIMLRRDNARRYLAEKALEASNTKLKTANTQVETLVVLGDALQSARTVEEVARITADHIGPTMNVDYLALSRRRGDVMRLETVWGTIPEASRAPVERGIHQSEGGLVWRVVESNAPVYTQTYPQEPGHLALNLNDHALAMEPVRGSDGHVQAVVAAGRSSSVGEWTDMERTILKRAATTLGLALERAEATRMFNEVRFRRVIESGLLGVVFWDRSTRIVDANDAFLEIVGFSRDELLAGKLDWRAITPPEYLEQDEQGLLTMRTTGQFPSIEKDYVRRDGTRVSVILGGAALEDANLEGVAFVLNVTEQKRAERAQRESEERFRTLVEATSQIVWTMPASGEFVTEQPAWASFTGQSFKEYSGMGWLEAVHPDDREHTMQAWTKAVQTGDVYEVEHRLCRRDREYRDMDVRAAPILESDGTLREWVGIHTDITARKRAERALQESETRSRALAESQKRFVSDASHELRAPLTAIQGNLELLRRYPNMPASDRDEALLEAEREATRLARLVSDLLALARGDSGAAVQTDELELRPVLLEAWTDAQRLTSSHRFELGQLEDSAVIVGNRDRIKQLALILLENAIKYTPAGGSIRLELRSDTVPNDQIEFRVMDTGTGISANDLPHVFERFYRADLSRTRGHDPGGTGLGLPIAKWITELHGGEIDLESEEGQGTRARVRLPRALIPASSSKH
jgi:PAS domain S-box-containing protein